ncbi:MAG TPA: S8 family serine peptidase [Longimicrobium sp.]|nr:S8 family serine peptidase [Longimicrobium sp.]
MKRLSASTLALFALGLSACGDQSAPLSPIGTTAASFNESASGGRHIVGFNGNKTLAEVQAAVAARGGSVEWFHEGAGIGVVVGLTDDGARALPGAAMSMADAEIQLDPVSTPDVASADVTGGEAVAASQANPTTAFFYPRQWHLRTIQANAAWAAGRIGSPSVKVAILDSGIDYTYPDLNGLVDLSLSRNFVPGDAPLVAANFPGKLPFTDLHYHGTHVASTVASKAIVSAGVTSNITLVALKVLGASGSGATSGVLNAVLYAADADVDVANMSLGSLYAKPGNGQFGGFVNRVFNYAHRQGTLIVVSGGNEGMDLQHNGNIRDLYCDVPNVVCVSATGPTSAGGTNGPWNNVDALASYSNWGTDAITVAAPGGNASPVWAACSQTTLAVPVCRTGNFTIGLSGTSMAAPHVTGLAALLVENVGRNNPAQLRHAIMRGTDDLGKPGRDAFYGAGRINVKTALGL